MWVINKPKILALTILIVLISQICSKNNEGEFIFYQGESPILIKDYDIYINKVDNVSLVIKNFSTRSYIVNNKIDSMNYVLNGKVYKAELNKISGKVSKFNLITQNDRSRLFVNGFNEYHQEMLYLGQKKDLDFIINNNIIIEEKE